MTNYEAWTPPWDNAPDLWEHQGHPLTVEGLREVCDKIVRYRSHWATLPVSVALYRGTEARDLNPVEIGFTGTEREAAAVVITVLPK